MTKEPSRFTDADWERFDHEHIARKARQDKRDIIYSVIIAVFIMLAFIVYQTTRTDEAQSQCKIVHSTEVCEYYIR